MALKFDPLKGRQQNKSGFFVDVHTLKPEEETIEEKPEAKAESVESIAEDSKIANQESQNTIHETQNVEKDKIVFLSTRVYKSQDKWLDSIVEKVQETHGKKFIKKEDLIRSAINLLKKQDIDWALIKSEEDLNKACS